MVEHLRTIKAEDFDSFADGVEIIKGSTLMNSTQCVVYKQQECPD